MSERKRKRGRPRVAPVLSYGTEIKMRNSISRKIQKPKYLLEQDELEQSRESTPARSIDTDRSSISGRGRVSRGYNAEIDHDSEYHYGSDFDLNDDSDEGEKDSSSSRGNSREPSDLGDSDMELDLDNGDADSVGTDFVPHWKVGHGTNISLRNSTPVPVWLQDRKFSNLILPSSSDDILIPKHLILKAVGIYEILRHFHSLVRLSPFRFEDFSAALICDEQNILMIEIHIALLKSLIREEDSQQTHFGPLDQKDSTNIALYFIDSMTWPENLKIYLQSDKEYLPYLRILENSEYPSTTLDNRLSMLQFLCDQFLQTSVVKEDLLNEGKVRYDDHCRVCHKTGDLLCCDSCSAVYHLDCADPPLKQSPSELEDWTCKVCKTHELTGVTDCVLAMEASGVLIRQEPLGYDRHGRKYWFLTRRIIVEAEDGEIWYFSTVDQFELLLYLIDSADLEENLGMAFSEFGDDIRRQMLVTEKLTDKGRGNNLTCLMSDREVATAKYEELRLKAQKEENKRNNLNDPQENLEMDILTGEIYVKPDPEDIKTEDSIKQELYEMPDEKKNLVLLSEKRNQLSTSFGKAPAKLKEDTTYRLGCDHTYKSYVNQYSTNSLALNKLQHNEDRDKKRHLNNKLSLGSPVEFKWAGPTSGTSDCLISTLRQTILALEQNISTHFFHPHWHMVRKSWQQAASSSIKPSHIINILRWLTRSVKPIVFHTVWHDAIGHLRLKKITAADREDKKKQEKKDKKEAEEESRLYAFVKYKRPFTHQLWKMKGEEYRIHGLWGWQWLSVHRRCPHTPMDTVGLRAGPDKICVQVKLDYAPGCPYRGLNISVNAFNQLAAKNSKLDYSILSPNQIKIKSQTTDQENQSSEMIIYNNGNQQKVGVIPVNLEDHFEDGLVNVSKSLQSEHRFVYPKICLASKLDKLLDRRLALRDEELKDIEAKKIEDAKKLAENDAANDSDATISDNEQDFQDASPKATQKLSTRDSKPTGHILKEMRLYKLKYEELDKQEDGLSCYTRACKGSARSTCYSPLCLRKERTKLKLMHCVNEYKIVSGKCAPFNQVGVNSPVTFNQDQTVTKSVQKQAPNSDVARGNESKYERIYSTTDTRGKIYLKKLKNEKKVVKAAHKIPPTSLFRYSAKHCDNAKPHRNSVMVLPQWEMKMLARKAGRLNVTGFNHSAKTNQSVWPYPCSRPLFKTIWQYKTTTMTEISTAALQLRVLWSCMRWEDMSEKIPVDGRKQVTTDTEIVQTEILKRKTFGRFLEKTEYLLRKVVIPLDVPKPMREFTPSQRSGLRKRRRAVSPVSKEPESSEVWCEEDKLSMWEVKHFGERIGKAALLTKKVAADKCNDTNSTLVRSSSPAELKAKLEEQLKIQRSNFNQKKALEIKSSSSGVVKVAVGPHSFAGTRGGYKTISGSSSMVTLGNNLPNLMAGRKIVTTKGGKIITVQASSAMSESPKRVTVGVPVTTLPKVQVANTGGKVLRFQSLPAGGRQRTILPRNCSPSVNVIRHSTPTSTAVVRPAATGQQIQIYRLPTGQLQVKGLQEGQKVLQRGDGKFHLVSKAPNTPTASAALSQTKQLPTKDNVTPAKVVSQFSAGQMVKIGGGQQVILRTTPTTKPPLTPATPIKKPVATTPVPPKALPTPTDTTPNTNSSSVTLRVQVKMTEQGPKTIIQGLTPGIGLTKDHIMAIQQQVKTMLSTQSLQINELSQLLTLQLSIPNVSKPAAPQLMSPKAKPDLASPLKVKPAEKKTLPIKSTDVVKQDTDKSEDQTKLPKKFILTNEYIQQSIKSALGRSDLSPDVEEKLMQLQKYTTEKSDTDVFLSKIEEATGHKAIKRKEPEESEWETPEGDTPKSKMKRQRTDRTAKAKKESPSANSGSSKIQDAKKRVATKQKLDGFLGKQKEYLKKDILKKRALLEKELQHQIHIDLNHAMVQVKMVERKLETASTPTRKTTNSSCLERSPQHHRKEPLHTPPSSANKSPPKTSSASKIKKPNRSKTKKIVCICRTAFDDSKFYVGCDLCGNWFHGDCVGITEASSRSMTEYVCDDCANAKLNKELFCFCKQPYDETKFYICCEKCEDWYHGKCVGIMQIEADDIDDYLCSKCEPNNQWNFPCLKKMTQKDYAELKKVAKSVVQHKNAWPFIEPVDGSEVPDYYKVVKEPMDLKTIEVNVNSHKYKSLREFVGDVMLVFDNCRAYNPPNSSFSSCASTLETFFCARLRQLKLKIASKI